ncbi:uncharacterized protein LOC142601155 isoform X3 [Balearica regulorum gibbericeps]|uniref:uncharacterized protein LOC142601155 isoform X3 n=1 Tax=Balearica regulorum gibbericeps TaxID=100784 RepID=UPI003F6088A6
MGQANCCCGSRGGTSVRPQLRLALEQLWVLSGGKEAAGEEEEEEQEGSGVDRSSLVFVWPSGSCIATFGRVALHGASPCCPSSVSLPTGQGCAGARLCPRAGGQRGLTLFLLLSVCSSRALKELWLDTLLGTPEGATRARVTRLPSLQVLERELRRRHVGRTFSARSLERLLEGQAEADPKQGLAPVPSSDAGAHCRSAGEYGKARPAPATDRLSCAHLSLECRHAGAVAQGRTSAGGARTPAGQRPLDVVLRGQGASAAAAARGLAGRGLGRAVPVARRLSEASQPEPRFRPLAPCPSCRTAQHRAAGQGRAGQGRLRERWPGGLH